MDMLLNQLTREEPVAVGYFVGGQPDPMRPVPNEIEFRVLPIMESEYHILGGDEHPEAPAFLRDYAEIVRTMARPCSLRAGAKIMVREGNVYKPKPSWLYYKREQLHGSRYVHRSPYILVDTSLTPTRPPQSCMPSSGRPADAHQRPITNLIGEEEVLRQVAAWNIHEADRIWPGDGDTLKWSDRMYQSMHEDQDVSRIDTAGLSPIEQIMDAFVQFAIVFLRNAALGRLAALDDVPFHTREFARIVTGLLAREIMENADDLWDR